MTTPEIEYAVAEFFDFRKCNVVPNVSWGAHIHECDLLVIHPSRYATEVEIKVSVSDCKADRKKEHKHSDERIRQLYFAAPKEIYEDCLPHIPECAGVMAISGNVRIMRDAPYRLNYRKLTQDEIVSILRLGNMRNWGSKRKLLELDGKRDKPKMPTKRERYDQRMYNTLCNVRHMIERHGNDLGLNDEYVKIIDRVLEEVDKTKIQQKP